MLTPARPLELPLPHIAYAPVDGAYAQAPLWQRRFFVPPDEAEAQREREALLAAGRARLSSEQRALLDTMGWSMRVPRPTHRELGTLSSPTPSPTDALQQIGRQAIVVASGMHGVHVSGTGEATLRILCKQRYSVLRQADAVIMDETVLEPLQRFSTPPTRTDTWAYLHAFGEGYDTMPAASLPKLYYMTFFRPLAVAFVASGVMGLWRAQAYLSCCEGADVAAYLAFFGPRSRDVLIDLYGAPRQIAPQVGPLEDARRQRAAAAPHGRQEARGAMHLLRAMQPPPRPVEPPVHGLGPVGQLPVDLRYVSF